MFSAKPPGPKCLANFFEGVALTVLEHLTDEGSGCAKLSYLLFGKGHPVGKAIFWLADNLLIEKVGEEILVLHADSLESLRLTGEAAKMVEELHENGRSPLPQSDAATELLSAGILETEQPSGLSRRSLLKTGAIGVGAGVASLALPTAAYAASASYVELAGLWQPNIDPTTGAIFESSGIDWPDELGSAFGVGIDPSVLTIVSLAGLGTPFTVPVLQYDARGNAAADFVNWEDSTRDFTGLSALTPVGTFSWVGVSYRITFSPVP